MAPLCAEFGPLAENRVQDFRTLQRLRHRGVYQSEPSAVLPSNRLPPQLDAVTVWLKREYPGWGPEDPRETAAANVLQQQARFDAFIDQYNRERPHQALAMKMPADVCIHSADAARIRTGVVRVLPTASCRLATHRISSPCHSRLCRPSAEVFVNPCLRARETRAQTLLDWPETLRLLRTFLLRARRSRCMNSNLRSISGWRTSGPQSRLLCCPVSSALKWDADAAVRRSSPTQPASVTREREREREREEEQR
jgi:hypothetical protein